MLYYKYNWLCDRTPNILGNENSLKSAVLVPLVNYLNQTHILFEVRAQDLNRSPGEICFPGGKLESADKNPLGTAIRETCEELTLTKEDIQIIGPLDYLVAPFNSIIYPFLCEIKDYKKVEPKPDEVAETFLVPLDFLDNYQPEIHHLKIKLSLPDDFPYHLIPKGKDYNWREGNYPEYFYIYQNYVIWGMTARILHHFLTLTKNRIAEKAAASSVF